MTVDEILAEAQTSESSGRWSRAAELYEKRLQADVPLDDRIILLTQLIRCLREDDRHDEAEDRISQARELVDEGSQPRLAGLVRMEEGRLSAYQGDHESARRKFAKALVLLGDFRTDHFEAMLASADLERSLGELRRADDLLQKVDTEELPPGQLADYLGARGAVQLASGNYRQAEETLNQALELDEAQSTDYGTGETKLLLAQAYLGQGDRDRARRLIEEVRDHVEAVDDTATLSDISSLLGQVYEDSDDFVNAMRWYQNGLNLDISAQDMLGQARAYRRMARVSRNRGDFRHAHDYLEDARPLCRSNELERAELLTEEGNLALDQGDYSIAEDKFRQAKQLIEDDGDDRRTAIASRNLARALREKGDLPRAENLMRQALPVLRDRGDLRELDDLLDDLGEVLLEQDRYEPALATLDESYQLDQQLGAVASQGRTLLLRGQALLRMGKRERAGTSLRSALAIYQQVGDEVGESNARFGLGEWYEKEGQLDLAIEQLRAGQAIDSRHNDRLGLGRAARVLASVYRRKGDLRRAAELLAEARRDLQTVDDRAEQAWVDMEAGRIAQARGAYADAEDSLRAANRAFDAQDSKVQAAVCQRLLACVASAQGRYDQAQAMLERAREQFISSNALPELDELYDDLGELFLRVRRLDDAKKAVSESLQLGRQMGWLRGKGRSLALLAQISLIRRDTRDARKNADDALANYSEVGDDVGVSEARVILGDCAVAEEDYTLAVREYKEARRIDMRLSNERGLARCCRKLGQVYRLRRDWTRAEESLEQAEDHLRNAQDLREQALFHLERGMLQASLHEHASAIHNYRQAAKVFDTLGDRAHLTMTYQRMAASYHSQGKVSDALSCVREMEDEHGSLWALMVRDLHPVVADAAQPGFMDGHYAAATLQAYAALEERIRIAAGGTGQTTEKYVPIGKVITDWLKPENARSVAFDGNGELGNWSDFMRATYALVRNPLAHKASEIDSREAFAALCVADLIARHML